MDLTVNNSDSSNKTIVLNPFSRSRRRRQQQQQQQQHRDIFMHGTIT
jgi:hypothetical protein